MQRKWFFRGIILIVIAGAAYRLFQDRPVEELVYVSGQTMGTIWYNVKYLDPNLTDHKLPIDSILIDFNQSLSTYISDSEISRLNATGNVERPSQMFLDVMSASNQVYEGSGGAFDATVGPLINAWGFGPDKILQQPDSSAIDSLKTLVDFSSIHFSEDSIAMDVGMSLDFSAIAKGYAVDLIAGFLENQNLKNYMVEIGGEVRVRGLNDSGEKWKIGIEDPTVDRSEQKLLAIVQLENQSMATSGNYRNYYKIGERTIAHTIDPRTGYNTNHNLLSASVFTTDCMSADAYATAAMVLGLDKSIAMLEENGLEGFFVYTNDLGDLATYVSEGLKSQVTLDTTKEE